MSVTQTARFPDDVHAALKKYCDRIGSNANAEMLIAVRKHIGMPTIDERVEIIEAGLKECFDRLKILEASAIATPQSPDIDIQSIQDD